MDDSKKKNMDYEMDDDDEQKTRVVVKRKSFRLGSSPSSNDNTDTIGNLFIYGAAYGPTNVTVQVRGLVASNQLNILVAPSTFKIRDPWPNVRKSLVVFYRYGSTANYSQVAYTTDGKDLTISTSSTGAKHDFAQTNDEICIIGAAYGLKDVTDTATSLVSSNSFVQTANEATFGTSSPTAYPKTLAVVYAYNSVPLMSVVKEGALMNIIDDSPTLTILGATYGPLDVSDIVRSYATWQNLYFVQNNLIMLGVVDPWKDQTLSLVVVYRYEGYLPSLQIIKPSDFTSISFINQTINPNNGNNINGKLSICGAAYGLADVTVHANSLIQNNALTVAASDDVWGDQWTNVNQSLTIVYRYGYHSCTTVATKEGSTIAIKSTPPQTTLASVACLNTNGLFDSNDEITVQTFSGLTWATNGNNELILSSYNPITLVLTVRDTDDAIQFKNKANNYVVYRDADGGLLFDTDGTAATASNSYFFTKMDKSGKLRFSIAPNFVVSVAHDKATSIWSVNAQNTEETVCVCALVKFDISITATPGSTTFAKRSNEQDSDTSTLQCAEFVWQLTGGFLSALGLLPFCSICTDSAEIAEAIYAIILNNAPVSKYINTLIAKVKNTGDIALFGPVSITGLLSLMYDEEILWKVIKMMLLRESWFGISVVFAKVIEITFLPEAEIAQLLAQFTVWQVQTVQMALAL